MTKKLEEFFDLDSADEETVEEESLEDIIEHAKEERTELMTALTNSEKINQALPAIGSIDEHDTEMDDIAKMAIDTFHELHDIGMNVSDAHTGKVFEVAATLLKTALDARDAKVNRKLKQIELMIKKQKLDADTGEIDSPQGEEFDRNELLKAFLDNKNNQESDK
jgi:hypothetical protein